VPYYVAALLSYQVSALATYGGWKAVAVHGGAVVLVTVVVVLAARYVVAIREVKSRETALRKEALSRAYTLCDRVLTWRIAQVNNAHCSSPDLLWALTASVSGLRQIVDAAHEALEGTYGNLDPERRIDFEVTFMTRSLADDQITIPAAANRDGRQPHSMLLRKSNPTLYETTVTATVFRENRPALHIIEDTARDDSYVELYPGQKKRIRSSIVFPVVSDLNELLGTIVAHCDQEGFFKHSHEGYWVDFFEIFAKRLAAESIKIRRLVQDGDAAAKAVVSSPIEPPY
jgi:hypothetical protein